MADFFTAAGVKAATELARRIIEAENFIIIVSVDLEVCGFVEFDALRSHFDLSSAPNSKRACADVLHFCQIKPWNRSSSLLVKPK